MNKVLRLHGILHYKQSHGQGGKATLPVNASVTVDDCSYVRASLINTLQYWQGVSVQIPPLVSVKYKSIVAKSNRIAGLLERTHSTASIVGAKYSEDKTIGHVITYRTSIEHIERSINDLDICISILQKKFDGVITKKELDTNTENSLKKEGISKNLFKQIIRDIYYIDRFYVDLSDKEVHDDQIVNIYDVGLSKKEIQKRLGLEKEAFFDIDDYSWRLTPVQFRKIQSVAPFLISMSLSDIREFSYDKSSYHAVSKLGFTIPSPGIEPEIGVIDTLFDTNAYFAEWVDYSCWVPDCECSGSDDYEHGTAVSSIIVDGPRLNPFLDDGCGRFRVRHFGVATQAKTNATKIMDRIKRIVESNLDIKVWNLSLGSNAEISKNFISPEAAILDELQYKYNIIFVVAGTNDNAQTLSKKIGMPADSINSIVVNSIDLKGDPALYSRRGPVLSFFTKPDVAVFGGTKLDEISVCSNRGRDKKIGTSFAAPWIARKLAYLIHILNLPVIVAKALLIDSASGWGHGISNFIGHGSVPIKIDDIITSQDDEIKFVIHGTVDEYDTYAYNIPVPQSKKKHPFVAKATLCYNPKCSRRNGVDYTSTELDLHFGRVHNGKIKPIDDNYQGEQLLVDLKEEKARDKYRKWDNVKHIEERIPNQPRGKKVYEKGFWGLSILTKERADEKNGKKMPFCLVVTLREVDGRNRFSDFVALCEAYHEWKAVEIDANLSQKVYEKSSIEADFDE